MTVWGYDPESGEFGVVAPSGRVAGRRIEARKLFCSEAVLDYVVQQAHRPGVYSDAEIGALVRALDRLLGLQENYCSHGINGAVGKVVTGVPELIKSRSSK